MTESTNATRTTNEIWEEVNSVHSDFMFAQLFGSEEEFEALRIRGLETCQEMARALRAGAPVPDGMDESEREAFLAEWPEGETLGEALAIVRAHNETEED